jgi:hypothetical protein
MLKTSQAVIAALLIAGSATTAFAASGNAHRAYRNIEPAGYAWQTRGAYAYAPRGYVDRAPTAVYEAGQYVGQDPDPSIRLQLQRETPPQ